ncbi:cytochrome c-type biogenesis protein [Hyphococcus sp.]|uniref:cytochrome c-type biogenesis protein n=1 Tax=Hyphococcus sp. TaxID=2038636 RepID=UPI0035C73CF7
MKYLLLIFTLLLAGNVFAAEPDELLDDPVLEERAEKIDAQLRCVVCQSQSIAESNAPLAKDLRLLVRERLVAGDTDKEVIAYVVERYGDYVLLKPPVQGNTLFLWAFPALALAAGGIGAYVFLRRPKAAPAAPISDEDEKEIDRLLEERG